MKQKLIDGDEHDALTLWKKWLTFSAGQRKRIKRKVNKRFRKEGKKECLQLEE